MDTLWAPWRMAYIREFSSHHKDGCVLCAIRDAEDDAAVRVVHRGENTFAFLNLFPYSNGHMMVAPNEHVASLEDMDETTLFEITTLTRRCVMLLRAAYEPEGFNVGINIGAAGGAGIAEHLHQHIVPRWGGDTNFMTSVAQTRVIPEWIDATYAELRALWLEKFADSK